MVPRSLLGVGALLLVLLLAAAIPPRDSGDEATPRVVQGQVAVEAEMVAILCPPGYDNGRPDNVCLAFNGTIPGPTFVFREGDAVTVKVKNRVEETVQALDVPPAVKSKFVGRAFSMHRHGTDAPPTMDGIAPHTGTSFPDSRVPAKGEFTYAFTTPFVGTWHYHDHAFGPDGSLRNPSTDRGFGSEGAERGLFGSLLVLPRSAPTPTVFDLHLLDHGPNGGLGMNGNVAVGERFLISLVGLGSEWWDVVVTDPDGVVIASHTVSAGSSHGVLVEAAKRGAYTWSAWGVFHIDPFEGQVVAS